jgi:serine/threonine protein kinase
MIVSKGRPDYKDAGAMSPEIKDFIEQCTQMEPADRPTMEQLMQVCRNAVVDIGRDLVSIDACVCARNSIHSYPRLVRCQIYVHWLHRPRQLRTRCSLTTIRRPYRIKQRLLLVLAYHHSLSHSLSVFLSLLCIHYSYFIWMHSIYRCLLLLPVSLSLSLSLSLSEPLSLSLSLSF